MSCRVLLVCMPYQNLSLSSLSVALLATYLREHGVAAEEIYPHFELGRLVGARTYMGIAESGTRRGLLGELLFAEAHWGEVGDAEEQEKLRNLFGSRAERRNLLRAYGEHCLARVRQAAPEMVGFTTSCNQLFPSLWLAAQIKRSMPEIQIILGGSACSEPMGAQVLDAYPEIDYVVSGFGERALLDLALGAQPRTRRLIRGLAPPDLDSLPVPSYDRYVRELEGFWDDPRQTMLAFESSRGCWWGQRNHCLFCGLHQNELAYRSKSSARVLSEIHSLWERYRINLFATDSILSRVHLREVMPGLAGLRSKPMLFYETKSNMTGAEVRTLRAANVRWIQPGIESLSTPLLAKLSKGVTAIQNVALLKWCRESEIKVSWNLLCNIPGESQEHYDRQIDLFERIPHLHPPEGVSPIRVDRFSPYFEAPEEYGWNRLEPLPEYRLLHPHLDEDQVCQIAYHFQGLGRSELVALYLDRLQSALARWRERHTAGVGLFWDETLGLLDLRPGDPERIERSPSLDLAIEESHEIAPLERLAEHMAPAAGLIEELLRRGVLLREGNRVINLTVRLPSRAREQPREKELAAAPA